MEFPCLSPQKKGCFLMFITQNILENLIHTHTYIYIYLCIYIYIYIFVYHHF